MKSGHKRKLLVYIFEYLIESIQDLLGDIRTMVKTKFSKGDGTL